MLIVNYVNYKPSAFHGHEDTQP